MKSNMLRRMLWPLFIASGLLWSASSYSGVVQIDQFTIQSNGESLLNDTFGNGLTPSQETRYSVQGAFPNGAESGGKLTLNSDWGTLGANAAEQARLTLGSQYLSNIDPANPNAGLNKNTTIDVKGIFSLVTPSGPLINGYGLQVRELIPGQGQLRNVELDVQYNAEFGGDVIRFLLQDFVNSKITTLGYVPFEPFAGADQIELEIFRPDTNNNDFYGAYAFGTGGFFDSFTTFATPGKLFENTAFVRARFIDYTAVVPEPGTLALFGCALAGLIASRLRKQESAAAPRLPA